MQSEDDLRSVSIIILLLHIYWFCYSLFIRLGLTLLVIDKILLGFNAKASLFVYPIYAKLFSYFTSRTESFGKQRGKKSPKRK
ncbi:YWFCY domain-containing protein [Myroides odoratimimus]|uniref:YWFCY domain-containing protein n=1 Tax=Myroides odoratimimus TaxID=76832 RepID=UPI0025772348|nr:YWFCY domain-containing protein [Myroides odoratimimus]